MPNVPGQKKSSLNQLITWKDTFLRKGTYLLSPMIRRIIANSSYLFSATGIVAVFSLVQNILVGRVAGVTGVGVLATIILFTSIVNRLASFRMSELVIKYIGMYTEEKDHAQAAAVFKIACTAEIMASILAFVLVILLAPLAAQWLAKDPGMTGWFMLYAFIILANLIAESSTGLMQIFNRYRSIAILSVWGSLVTLVGVALVFIYFQVLSITGWAQINVDSFPDLIAFFRTTKLSSSFFTGAQDTVANAVQAVPAILVAYILGKIVNAVGLTGMALHTASSEWGKGWWKTPISILRPQARELVNFAVSTNLSASLSLINKDAEALWISLFRSPTETGYYRTALSLINLVQLPVSPLPQATYPELSREVARRNWRGVSDILRRGSFLSGSFSLVISVILALLGQQLILLLYKDPGFLPAYPALMILLPGFLIANTFFWNRIALLAFGRPDFPTKLNLVLAIAKIGGIFLLVPRYGYLASAALLSASYLVGVSIAVWKSRSILRKLKHESEPVESSPTVEDLRG